MAKGYDYPPLTEEPWYQKWVEENGYTDEPYDFAPVQFEVLTHEEYEQAGREIAAEQKKYEERYNAIMNS